MPRILCAALLLVGVHRHSVDASAAAEPSCRDEVFLQKLSDRCVAEVPTLQQRVPCTRFLFVSGCGYSGTHFASHAFNINVEGVRASHEKSQ